MTRPSRRRVLIAAAGLLGGLAGCAGQRRDRRESDATAAPTATPTSAPADPSPADRGAMDGTPAAPERVDDHAAQFVAHLAAEEFEWAAGLFGGVLARVDAGRLGATWRGLTIQHGPYQGFDVLGREVQGDRSLRALDLRFETATQRLSLVFNPYARIVGLDFPTRASRVSPVGRSFDVTLSSRSAADACSLGATITLPPGDGVVPGVVVVHRTGPLDRDGAVGPNRPYRDLAAGLAARGVATVRYDKRTFACELSRAEQSFENVVVADAVAAAERLAAVDRVSDVVVFGHGLGGAAAPLVAQDVDLAGLVLAATPTRPFTDVFFETEAQKAAADGRVTFEEQQRLDFFREKLDQVDELTAADDYYLLGTATGFWRDLRALDVVDAVRSRPEPTLALHAGRSFVTMPEDRDTWRTTLETGSVRAYPDLDHLFMRVFDDSLPEAYFFPDTVDARVIDDVAGWVLSLG